MKGKFIRSISCMLNEGSSQADPHVQNWVIQPIIPPFLEPSNFWLMNSNPISFNPFLLAFYFPIWFVLLHVFTVLLLFILLLLLFANVFFESTENIAKKEISIQARFIVLFRILVRIKQFFVSMFFTHACDKFHIWVCVIWNWNNYMTWFY